MSNVSIFMYFLPKQSVAEMHSVLKMHVLKLKLEDTGRTQSFAADIITYVCQANDKH